MKKLFIILFGFLSLNVCAGDLMDQARMEGVIIEHAASHAGGGGMVEFKYHGVKMAVISDVRHDRMRIITPVVPYAEMSKGQIDAVMEANYHSALDARYAVSRGVLYAAFIHPLSSLSERAIEDAMNQVANLALSFGNEYTSGNLTFDRGK